METVRKSAVVPYSAVQMYALVNDIESYPGFLPWCSGARVDSREDRRLTASITFALAKLHYTFSTENAMDPGRRIDVRLLSGPFRHLGGHWIFEPAGARSCRVALEMHFEFKNRAVQLALGKPFNHIVNSLVDVFTRRAAQVYGSN